MKGGLIYLSVIFIGNFAIAQTDPIKQINTIQEKLNIQIKQTGGNAADSFSRICAANYHKALDSVVRIFNANKKEKIDLIALWKSGADNGSAIQERNLLIASILNTPDSGLLDKLQKCDLVTYIPPRQTECCAIPDHFDYDSAKTKNIDPLVLAALSKHPRFQNQSNSGSGIETALLHSIGVEMVNKGLLYSTANGYTKRVATQPGSRSDNSDKAIASKNKKASAQPIWLWLSGGFLLAVILYFILGRRK